MTIKFKVHSVNLITDGVQMKQASAHSREDYASVNVESDVYVIGGEDDEEGILTLVEK